MDEYHVLHFYHVKPTINCYLVEILNIICTHNFTWYAFYILYTYDLLYTIHWDFILNIGFLFFYNHLLAFY